MTRCWTRHCTQVLAPVSSCRSKTHRLASVGKYQGYNTGEITRLSTQLHAKNMLSAALQLWIVPFPYVPTPGSPIVALKVGIWDLIFVDSKDEYYMMSSYRSIEHHVKMNDKVSRKCTIDRQQMGSTGLPVTPMFFPTLSLFFIRLRDIRAERTNLILPNTAVARQPSRRLPFPFFHFFGITRVSSPSVYYRSQQ